MISSPALPNARPARVQRDGATEPLALSRLRRNVQVLIEPFCNRGVQGEMELNFIAIQGAPVPLGGSVRFAIRIERAKFHGVLLDAILVARGAVLGSDPQVAQA